MVVAVTNPLKYSFNRCKSVTCKFFSRDTKSARNKNGTKPRKNKVKNTSPEISLVEYHCFVCKGTNLSLEKRGGNLYFSHSQLIFLPLYPKCVFANGFDLKQHGLRKSCVKFCFALCWTFSKTRTGNRTKDFCFMFSMGHAHPINILESIIIVSILLISFTCLLHSPTSEKILYVVNC